MSSDAELRQKARARAEAKLGFYIHLAVYCAVNTMLFLIWFFTNPTTGFFFPWFLFPLVFWGIGLVAHYLTTFSHGGTVDRWTEEEYRKLKAEQ